MTADKSISQRIDETIDGILRFLLRYLKTALAITIRPMRTRKLLADATRDREGLVRPLTFLSIGAFLFAILIDVYPKGFAGVIDFIWLADEIKANVRARWKEAVSISDMVLAGLPTILTISSMGALSGGLFFREPAQRRDWFNLSCYAFGYQTALIFLLMSLDSILSGLSIAIPPLESVALPASIADALSLGLLAVVVIGAVCIPLLVLAAGLLHLRPQASRLSRAVTVALSIGFWGLTQYLYAGAASVLPALNERYFPDAQPTQMIIEHAAAVPSGSAIQLVFDILLDNPTARDELAEIEKGDIAITVSRGGTDRPIETWSAEDARIAGRPASTAPIRVLVSKQSKALVTIEATFANWQDICSRQRSIDAADRANPKFDDALAVLHVQANVRYRFSANAEFSRSLDESALPACESVRSGEGGASALKPKA